MFDNESTQKTSENRFSIEETAESGFGMIATTNIPAGDIIVREKPVLVIPPEVKDAQYSW